MKLKWWMLPSFFLLTQCLQTREAMQTTETRSPARNESSRAVPTAQATHVVQYEEMQDSMRQQNGRIEVLERKVSDLLQSQQEGSGRSQEDFRKMQERIKAYDESLTKMETELQEMRQLLVKSAAPPPVTAEKAKAGDAPTTPHAAGDYYFQKKSWREAILAFEKYRQANPKGKYYSSATLKIGISFDEMGMPKEARVFYQEVIEKFPGSKEAKAAAQKLKKI